MTSALVIVIENSDMNIISVESGNLSITTESDDWLPDTLPFHGSFIEAYILLTCRMVKLSCVAMAYSNPRELRSEKFHCKLLRGKLISTFLNGSLVANTQKYTPNQSHNPVSSCFQLDCRFGGSRNQQHPP